MAADMTGRPHPSDNEVGARDEPRTSDQPRPNGKANGADHVRPYLRQT